MRTMDTKREVKPPEDRRYVNMVGKVTSLIDMELAISYPVKVIKKDGVRQ